jgi:hypothetical protein
VFPIDKNTKNLDISIIGAPSEIIQKLCNSLGLQLSFLTILILSTIFRVWSTLPNEEYIENFQKTALQCLGSLLQKKKTSHFSGIFPFVYRCCPGL